MANSFTTSQLRAIVLDVFGIAFVAFGFYLLFPFQGAPTHAAYLTASNVLGAETAMLIGILMLIVALIESVASYRKRG